MKSIHRNTWRLCTEPWSVTVLFIISRGEPRIKQGNFTIIDNEANHWFLHNFFNIHTILDFVCCNSICFLQIIHSDKCRFLRRLDRSLLYFEVQEEHQEQNKISSLSLMMNPTNFFSIKFSILTRLWCFFVVTASDFYRESIEIRVVSIQILDW